MEPATRPDSSDRLGTLLAITNAIVNCRTERELVDAVARALRPVVSFDNLGMTFFDATTARFRFVAMAAEDTARAFAGAREVGPRTPGPRSARLNR